MSSVASVVDAAVSRLCNAGFSRDDARRDVSVLARGVLRWSLADWLVRSANEAPETFKDTLDALVSRRQQREPVAYLLGEKEFYGRTFRVDRHTLIPRPETEGLVDAALAWLGGRALRASGSPSHVAEGRQSPIRVIDIGTGTGCIAITLALETAALPPPVIHATDISAGALAIARDNAARLGATAVTFHSGSLLAGVSTPVDLVVSNPPYVSTRDRGALEPDVAEHEPHTALFAGEDGLDVIRRLIPVARRTLSPGGALMMEIGVDQSDAVSTDLEAEGFVAIERLQDLRGVPRILVAHVAPGQP